ncbi:MAG: glycosyltransferase family 2 protein, partial [Thermomicrobium sp.]|nr:glycosyltransferase family 2 protein [Thermomicrobium sp.]
MIDANIAFHLNAGVDFVIATDNRSDDGTTDVFRSYEREGHLHLIQEDGEGVQNGLWVTRMARLAAREFRADWLIHADADEFYWPRGGSLKDVLAVIPPRYGVVRTIVRTFPLRPDTRAFFAERMTVRFSAQAPINDPTSIFRPGSKLVHRAHPNVSVGDGTHSVEGPGLELIRGYAPIELLHFPFRTTAQAMRKLDTALRVWLQNREDEPPYYYKRGAVAIQRERLHDMIAAFTVDDQALAKQLSDGLLVVDTRLRDALRELRVAGTGERCFRVPPQGPPLAFPAPSLDEEVGYGVDI